MAERYDYDRERRWRDQSGDRWNNGGQDWDDENQDQNQDWNRTRQWRQDYEGNGRYWQREDQNRGQGYDRSRQPENRFHQDENRDWNQGSSGEDYDWDYGQSQRSGRDFGQQYRDRTERDPRMSGDDRWGAAYGGDRGNYGEPRGRQQGANRDEQIYNRDWYNWDYEGGEDYEDDFRRNQQYGDTRDVARWRDYGDSNRRGYQRGGQGRGQSGEQNRQQNRGDRWSGQYRSAGMGSDYGQDADYERRDYRDENLNYRRGDVGYDSEGAFYQDMDEPINNRYGWDVPGRYSGVGPQNYRRSDQRILEDVNERLANHGRIDASDVEIDVNGGEVTLKGTVPSREMKRLAEDVAIAITGVQDVHNEIKIKPRQQDQGRRPNLTNRGYDLGEDWDRGSDVNRDSGDWNNRDRSGRDRYASDMQRDQNRQDWSTPRAENSPAGGQSNVGAGLTNAGATSIEGMEAASGVESKRSQLREGMEVIDQQGKVIGRVKEIRESDFLVDREMARDIYVPFSAIESVGAQAMLSVLTNDVDNQGWEKPNIL